MSVWKLPTDPAKPFPLQNFPDWIVWHIWYKGDCEEINFPQPRRQFLTLHFDRGSDLAYFDFVPADEKAAEAVVALSHNLSVPPPQGFHLKPN